MIQEQKAFLTGSPHPAHQRMVKAILEGWRRRQCYGIRSLHDLTKFDGLCERCRFLFDRESYEVTRHGSSVTS